MRVSWIFLKSFFISLGYLSPIWLTLCGIISGLGLIVADQEGLSFNDGMYLAWVTALTVGYGDISPEHRFSRLLCIFIALTGIILTGLLVALAVNSVKRAMQHYDKFHEEKSKIAFGDRH